jgi:hypothetical protein
MLTPTVPIAVLEKFKATFILTPRLSPKRAVLIFPLMPIGIFLVQVD